MGYRKALSIIAADELVMERNVAEWLHCRVSWVEVPLQPRDQVDGLLFTSSNLPLNLSPSGEDLKYFL